MRDELVTAPIGTIHSFYARILRAFPVEAGIEPGFRVLDETEADMLLTQALDTVFQQAGDAPGLDAVAAVLGAQALEAGSGFARELGNRYRTLLNRGNSGGAGAAEQRLRFPALLAGVPEPVHRDCSPGTGCGCRPGRQG